MDSFFFFFSFNVGRTLPKLDAREAWIRAFRKKQKKELDLVFGSKYRLRTLGPWRLVSSHSRVTRVSRSPLHEKQSACGGGSAAPEKRGPRINKAYFMKQGSFLHERPLNKRCAYGGSPQGLPSSKWRVSKPSSRLFFSLVLANVLVI